jgi:hypothetical protein
MKFDVSIVTDPLRQHRWGPMIVAATPTGWPGCGLRAKSTCPIPTALALAPARGHPTPCCAGGAAAAAIPGRPAPRSFDLPLDLSGRHRHSSSRVARAAEDPARADHQLRRASGQGMGKPSRGAGRGRGRGPQPGERHGALPPRAGHRRRPDRLCRRAGAQDRALLRLEGAPFCRCRPSHESHCMNSRATRPGVHLDSANSSCWPLWGASFLFMRLAASTLAAAHRRACAWGWRRCSCGPSCCAAATGRRCARTGGPFCLWACSIRRFRLRCCRGRCCTSPPAWPPSSTPQCRCLARWWPGPGWGPPTARAAGAGHRFVGVALLAWAQGELQARGHRLGGAGLPAGIAVLRHVGQLHQTLPHGHVPLATATGSQLGAARWLWPCPPCGCGRHRCPASAPGGHGGLAVLCTGIAYILYFRLIERLARRGRWPSPFLVPVFALAYGALFLGESDHAVDGGLRRW